METNPKVKKNVMRVPLCAFFSALLCLIVASCQSNPDNDAIQFNEIKKLNQENFISEDEILSKAGSVFINTLSSLENSKNNGENETRSSVQTDIITGKTILGVSSFKDVQDNVSCYAVNFEEGGFIILSADKRAPEVLAFSENESFIFDEDDVPYGVTLWVEDVNNAMYAIRNNSSQNIVANNTEENSEEDNVTTYSGEIARILPPRDYFSTTTTPLATTTWGQSNGYNDSLGYCSPGQKMLAGCATVAIAQFLKYYNYPNVYNWSLMDDNNATGETAKLYRDIVNASYANAVSCSATSTTIDNTQRTLAYFGFTNTSDSYSLTDVYNEFRSHHRPLLIHANNTNGSGHIWLCDGFIRYVIGEYDREGEPGDTVGTIRDYLHMNWGWFGNYNGYYLENSSWSTGVHTWVTNSRGMIYLIWRKYDYPHYIND
jgi:hypothetical protein